MCLQNACILHRRRKKYAKKRDIICSVRNLCLSLPPTGSERGAREADERREEVRAELCGALARICRGACAWSVRSCGRILQGCVRSWHCRGACAWIEGVRPRFARLL